MPTGDQELREKVHQCVLAIELLKRNSRLRTRSVRRSIRNVLTHLEHIQELATKRDQNVAEMTITGALIEQSVEEIKKILGGDGRGSLPERVATNELLIKTIDNKFTEEIKERGGWSIMWVSVVASAVIGGIVAIIVQLVVHKS